MRAGFCPSVCLQILFSAGFVCINYITYGTVTYAVVTFFLYEILLINLLIEHKNGQHALRLYVCKFFQILLRIAPNLPTPIANGFII